MECVIGIQCKDFVIVAADTVSARSVLAMKHDLDKTYKLSDNLLMAIVGDSGDTTNFAEFIERSIQLYKMRNGYELSPHAAANFTRRNLAEALRSRGAYQVNLLMAGFDKESGPQLYYMDYLAAMSKLPFAVHGYGSFFSLSVMDKYYREDMSKEEAVDLLQKSIDEIKTRFIVNLPTFKVKVVDKDGIRELADMTPVNSSSLQESVKVPQPVRAH